MDPLTFDSDLMFALIIFQLYGQKWEETASEIENHLPLYQPFSICLLTDITRNDLPLLFNHSSSLSLVIVKKMSRFNVLSFSEAVSHFDSSFACFSSTGCPKMKVPYWILRTTFGDWSLFSGLPPNSIGIVLGHPVYSCLPSTFLPPERCPEADWRKKETPLIICLLHLHPFHFPDWYYPNFQGCRQLFSKQDSFIHDYKMRRIQLKSFTKNCATLLKSTIDLEWQEEWYISIFNQYVKTGTSWDLRTLNNALCHKGCHFWGGCFSRTKFLFL